MARSNKPAIWLPFAAGGTVAAFLLPAVMTMLLLISMGVMPLQWINYERMLDLAGHPSGKGVIFFGVVLPLWHAAHRFRMTIQDLGVRGVDGRAWLARICYSAAAVTTMFLLYALWKI